MDQNTPLIFTIRNASLLTSTVEIPFFGNNTGFLVSPSSEGSKISVKYNNLSYRQFILWILTSNIDIEKMWIASNNSSQLTMPMQVKETSVRGSGETRKMTIVKDPYQKQGNIAIANQKFSINKDSHLIVSILPNTTVQLRLFPSKTTDNSAYRETKITRLPNIIKQGNY